jgi:hypothetical protein
MQNMALVKIIESQMEIVTKGRSDTISAETAENLLASIQYVIQYYLEFQTNSKDYNQAGKYQEKGLMRLDEEPLFSETLYNQALDYMLGVLKETASFYQVVMDKRLKVDNHIYNETFEQGISMFIENYDPRIGAQMSVGDIDYPLAFDDLRVEGIRYIINYLQTFAIENYICSAFGRMAVEEALKRFGEKMKVDYREYPVNLYELSLQQALVIMLTSEGLSQRRGKNMLLLRRDMKREVVSAVMGKSPKEITQTLQKAAEDLANWIGVEQFEYIEKRQVQDYYKQTMEAMVNRLTLAFVEHNFECFV